MKTISIYEALLVLGRGVGQVMFQNNALSGGLMLLGIFLHSWQLALLAVAGNVISTLTAAVLDYGREDIRNGLYGFNGTLVGIAAGVFMPLSWVTLLLMTIAACLSTWIARLFSRQCPLPGFTAPFILSVWLLLGICTWFIPSLLLPAASVAEPAQSICAFQAFSWGIGQVMFQENWLTGLLFLLGILVNSRTATFYTLLGVLLPLPLAMLMGVDAETLNRGLMGYNGVLCAMALGDRTWEGLAWASASVALSVVLQWAGMAEGITTLTAPFVVSVWIILFVRKAVRGVKH